MATRTAAGAEAEGAPVRVIVRCGSSAMIGCARAYIDRIGYRGVERQFAPAVTNQTT